MSDRRIGRKIARALLTSSALIAPMTMPVQAAAAAQSPAPATVNLNIPAQDLGSALSEFARESNQQLLYSPKLVKGKTSAAVSGSFAPADGLRRLLGGSGVSFKTASSGAFLLSTGTPQGNTVAGGPNAGTESASSKGEEGAAGAIRAENERAEQQAIVVTGTHIRGEQPIGSHLTVLGHEDIRRTGFDTVQDLLREIPQNFPNAEEIRGGTGNFARTSSFNLRGLGSGATLTLINGQRTSASGDAGSFTEVNGIPVAAIDRIEVLPDGASAIYGSDAIAGIVNIVLKRDFDGAETQLRHGFADGLNETSASQLIGRSWATGNFMAGAQYYHRSDLRVDDRDYALADKTSFGGSDFRTTFSNPGTVVIGSTTYAVPTGQNGTSLTVASFKPGTSNLQDPLIGTDILPKTSTISAFLHGRQDLGQRFELTLDGRYAFTRMSSLSQAQTTTLSVPKANAFYVNPTGGTGNLSVRYNFIDDLGPVTGTAHTSSYYIALGAKYQLSSNWKISSFASDAHEHYSFENRNILNFTALSAALADSNPSTAFNPFADGSNTNEQTLNAIRLIQKFSGSTETRQVNAVADGPIVQLPGGPVSAAFGADYRQERLHSSQAVSNPYSRSVYAAFGEISAHLVSDRNAVPGIRELSLSAAVRYDHYSDFGETTNPKLGFIWKPLNSLSLRGTWGTSFRAPNLVDLDDQVAQRQQAIVLPTADPKSPTGTSTVVFIVGNNHLLRPETAHTWTMGADWVPPWIRAFRASITYFNVDYNNRIIQPGPVPITAVLQQEATWADIITRNPTSSQLQAACALVAGGTCGSSVPTVIADLRKRNIAALAESGIDLDLRKQVSIGGSDLQLAAVATYVFHYRQQVAPGSPTVDLVNTTFNPPHLKGRATAVWNDRSWSFYGGFNFTGEMRDLGSKPVRGVGRSITIDAGVSYSLLQGALRGATLSFRVVNLFNAAPPFVNNGLGFDSTNASPLGRFATVELVKKW